MWRDGSAANNWKIQHITAHISNNFSIKIAYKLYNAILSYFKKFLILKLFCRKPLPPAEHLPRLDVPWPTVLDQASGPLEQLQDTCFKALFMWQWGSSGLAQYVAFYLYFFLFVIVLVRSVHIVVIIVYKANVRNQVHNNLVKSSDNVRHDIRNLRQHCILFCKNSYFIIYF